jgi:hypothetical protein
VAHFDSENPQKREPTCMRCSEALSFLTNFHSGFRRARVSCPQAVLGILSMASRPASTMRTSRFTHSPKASNQFLLSGQCPSSPHAVLGSLSSALAPCFDNEIRQKVRAGIRNRGFYSSPHLISICGRQCLSLLQACYGSLSSALAFCFDFESLQTQILTFLCLSEASVLS